MRAVILAAGMGTRLRPLSENCPKALIEVGGKPLLEHTLSALQSGGIKDVIIVVGHLQNKIKERFSDRYQDLTLVYVQNEKYAETGSMYSFSQAREIIGDEDVILLESDLLFDSRVIPEILDASHENILLAGGISGSGDEVFLCTNENQQLVDLGKHISSENKRKSVGELVGISKFSAGFLKDFFDTAQMDYREGKTTYHYEEHVLVVSKLGYPVHVMICNDLVWIEVDKREDLEKASSQIFPKLRSYQV